MHIFGFEPDFAWDLTLGFVHLMLGNLELTVVDDAGRTIRFPKPDPVRWGLEDRVHSWHLQNQ